MPKKIKTGAEKTRWDLSFLYSGPNDPLLDKDTSRLVEMIKNFSSSHKGRLAETLGQAINDLSEINMLQSKIDLYLYLTQSLNVAESAIKSKIAEVEKMTSWAFGEYMSFFDIELVALDDTALNKLYTDEPVVAKHRPWIEHVRVFKPHLLTEQVESALAKRSPFGSGAWSELFDELEADLEFKLGRKKLNIKEIHHILTESKDAKERFEAMTILNKGLGGSFAKYSAQTLYMVTGSGGVENKERSYRHPMEGRNKSNRIPDSVVTMLHKAVEEVAGPLVKRYYRLKAHHLGLKTLRWSDRNAQMPFSDNTVVTFKEATDIVLAAYESFSPTLAGLIRESIKTKKIDAPATKSKRSGAFNFSVVLPEKEPVSFTFLNYLGSNRDAMVLAHELGHGVHGLLAGKEQGPLMSRAPIAYCETASVFGEMTTYNFLKKRLKKAGDDKALLAMVMGKIDDIINTAVRQIGFSNFERRIHGMDSSYTTWAEPKKLSVGDYDKIWLETLKQLYGEEGEVFTYENTEHLWSYISHFHRPFYVYGYAFGELLTQSLYARQSDLGDKFETLYLDLLRSGGTKNIVELVKPFNLDPTQEKFWADGIKVGLGAMIEEAEELSRNL